jgi:hypothetical protein
VNCQHFSDNSDKDRLRLSLTAAPAPAGPAARGPRVLNPFGITDFTTSLLAWPSAFAELLERFLFTLRQHVLCELDLERRRREVGYLDHMQCLSGRDLQPSRWPMLLGHQFSATVKKIATTPTTKVAWGFPPPFLPSREA